MDSSRLFCQDGPCPAIDVTRKWREMSLGIPRSNLPSSAPELKELKGFLGKLKVVKNWDDSNWEWLQRFWNRQLEWVRLVTTGYPKWIRVEIGESFTAPQIYGHKLMEACWQTNRFSDKPKSAGWPMYSKNAKSTFLRRFFFWGGRPGKLRKQLPEHAMNYIHLQGFKASFQLPATVKYVYLSKSSIYNNINVCIYIYNRI